ncbi:MAG: MBL fold metallo-hydrolase [Ornithinimicrobium sp.]
MKITHLGHSCLLIEMAGVRLLIDPGSFSDVSGVRDLNAILVTHTHPDHLDPPSIPPLLRDNPGVQVWLEGEAADRLVNNEPQLKQHTSRLTSGEVLHFGDVAVTPVGDQHALIHDYVPRPDNIGLVISAPQEPRLFHPGDALDAEHEALEAVDVLCVPINAPWARVSDTVAFVRRIAPRRVVPIHDGLLNDSGRAMYVGHIGTFGSDDGVDVLDLKNAGEQTIEVES